MKTTFDRQILCWYHCKRCFVESCCIFHYLYFQIDIQEKEDAKHLYFRYLPGTVRFITAFAKEIPLFKSLTERDQRLLIKSGILEISAINDSIYMEQNDDAIVNSKLNVSIPKDRLSRIGILGNLFSDLSNVVTKLKKLNFTDVELSLLSAIVLFCPGIVVLYIITKESAILMYSVCHSYRVIRFFHLC